MANRKLQGEIERVLKKVDEGVQVFEQIWDKVYSATTTAQKEKYEGDLKKEIKKLQRLRDQIKTWQGDSSIKDKTKLDANRKLIEEKMEKFKICEKETKTKAFSKEGLAQDRTDPKKKAKEGVGKWVQEAINRLKEQSEEMEAEIETLNSGKRKKRSEENPRVTQLKENISRHEYHTQMLERVLRAVYNDAVTPDEATDLKESVDYYIESNQDPDFFEDDEMYDTLNLESAPAPTVSKKAGKTRDRDKDKEKDKDKEQDEEDDDAAAAHPVAAAGKKAPSSPRNTRAAKATASSTPANTRGTLNSTSAARAVSPKNTRNERSPTLITPHSPRNGAGQSAGRDTAASRVAAPPLLSTVVKGSTVKPGAKSVPPGISAADVNGRQATTQRQMADVMSHAHGMGISPTGQQAGDDQRSQAPAVSDPQVADATTAAPPELSNVRKAGDEVQARLSAMDPKLAAVEAALAFMPESPSPAQKTPTQGFLQQRHIGNGTTAPPAATLTPRNPIKVPPSFPNVPAPVFDSKDVFEQFDPDTLFFIFYYQQGTYQQYLAATELKRQGWRFHKKYLTWFQRHDEPKRSTDEYETGTFIYFDYANVVVRGQGTGWCQRIKSEFVFEYRFLEDELV